MAAEKYLLAYSPFPLYIYIYIVFIKLYLDIMKDSNKSKLYLHLNYPDSTSQTSAKDPGNICLVIW